VHGRFVVKGECAIGNATQLRMVELRMETGQQTSKRPPARCYAFDPDTRIPTFIGIRTT
jgi:hypothetical protein